MIIGLQIRTVGPVPGVAKRELNRILKEAYQAAGILWHQEMRPKHFTHAGATEYSYEPRAGERGSGRQSGPKGFARSYTGRKLKRFGHTLPLVYTGDSRELTRARDVRATSKGVRVVMNAPALNFKNPKSNINMREEMTRISMAEREQLTALIDQEIGERLNAIQETNTETIS